jgi:hypothetical protein
LWQTVWMYCWQDPWLKFFRHWDGRIEIEQSTNKRIGLFNVHCCTLPKTSSKGIKGMVGQNYKCRAMRKEIGSCWYWNFTAPWIDFALQHPRSPSILV